MTLLVIEATIKNKWLIIFPIITIPMIAIILALIIYLDINLNKKCKEDCQKFLCKIEEKLSNIYLWDFRVITFKEWCKIKKNKDIYHYFRSEDCFKQCYNTTFELANIIENPKVKILWISRTYADGSKWGHAILKKGNYIYDSNMRRTYNLEKYMKYWQAEKFKEFSIDEYTKGFIMHESYNNFGIWCQERGITRNI